MRRRGEHAGEEFLARDSSKRGEAITFESALLLLLSSPFFSFFYLSTCSFVHLSVRSFVRLALSEMQILINASKGDQPDGRAVG